MNIISQLFSPIIYVMSHALTFLHGHGLPWWLSIAVLTAFVRALLFPLTVKQVKSMRSMQDLKPEMDKLRAKYQDNKQKQQEELMKLYQERGVNPLGGCLPIVVQMPVFIGVYYVVRLFEHTQPSFETGGLFWFQDLTHRDPYFILPIASALIMLAATEITSKSVDPQQRWLMRLLPVVVTVFLWRFPAGLFVYWITSNTVTLIQNYVIYHHGPGKKKSPIEGVLSKAFHAGSDEEDSRNGAGSPNGTNSAETEAAKRAKRKRRKKKR